jgi:hypothetical protein
MTDLASSIALTTRYAPCDKGKLIGADLPLRPKHVWSIRTRLQVDARIRDLALLNLAIRGWARPQSGNPAICMSPRWVGRQHRLESAFVWDAFTTSNKGYVDLSPRGQPPDHAALARSHED